MKLYHCADARSLRPLWAIEEMGIDCELVVLPFPPRARDKSFLEENPLGTVPLLVDGDTRMTESAAICDYLGHRFGSSELIVGPEEPGYGAYLNGLHQGEATLTFPLTLVLRYGRFEPAERQLPSVVEDYGQWFLARLRTLAATLEREPFAAAGRFTMADISIGYALFLGRAVGLSARYPATVSAYLDRLLARPGFIAARARQGTTDLLGMGA